MAEITLDKVSKRFSDGTVAVRDLSFTVADGEFFILLGPSGCGKSTILNMIVGLESVSAGRILVDGEVVNEVDPKDRNMAMVFQSYALYPHMTVRENMEFPLKMARMAKPERRQRVEEAAEILEIADYLDRLPRSLSGGQRQRVAMGRAIVRQPKAFLLDEPLSNLDAKLRVQMRAEVSRLRRQLSTTMVYVTHDQTEAMTLGDRLVLLRKGEVQQIGPARELYNRPDNLFTAGFIGSPAMNFLPTVVADDRLRLPMVELPLPRSLRERPARQAEIIAGLRPEHIQPRNSAPAAHPAFEAQVTMVEWLGQDAYVHFEVKADVGPDLAALAEELGRRLGREGRISMVARSDPGSRFEAGERIGLAIAPDSILFFDGESGERLS